MRKNRAFTALFIGFILIVSYFLFSSISKLYIYHKSDSSFETFKAQFLKTDDNKIKSLYQFSIQSIIKSRYSSELSDLSLELPHYHQFTNTSILELRNYAKDCKGTVRSIHANSELSKSWIWQKFLCGKIKKLPDSFFKMKPLVHPSGSSFMKLALGEKNRNIVFPESFENYLTLSEILEKGNNFQNHLSKSLIVLESLLSNEDFILTNKFVLVLARDDLNAENQKNYNVYELNDWLTFSKNDLFILATDKNSSCLKEYATGCWIRNPAIEQNSYRLLIIQLTCFLLLLIGVILWFIFKQFEIKKREENQLKFILQMLAHELRTPVSSILIIVENLKKYFEAAPEKMIKEYSNLAEESNRLKRVIDLSINYVKLNQKSSLDDCSSQMSVNSIVEKVNSNLNIEIEYINTHLNFMFYADFELLWFCLDNLIRNSISHGKYPIKLMILKEDKYLVFKVQDQGELFAKNLKELQTRNLKKKKNKNGIVGLGLGLSLVDQICKNQKWEFELKNKPTQFIIKIKLKDEMSDNIDC